MLATVAEEGRARSEEGRRVIKEYMQIFKEQRVENIILGCTHYPIYNEIIKEELGYDVNLINTGKTVANYLKENLKEKSDKEAGIQKIYLSRPDEKFVNIARSLLNIEFEVV